MKRDGASLNACKLSFERVYRSVQDTDFSLTLSFPPPPSAMFPTLPSLLSRPYASTVFRVPRVTVTKGSTAVSKNYFTANGARGCTHPSYLYCARGPSPAISPIPIATHEQVPLNRKGDSCYLLRVGVAGVGLALTFLAAPVLYCDRTWFIVRYMRQSSTGSFSPTAVPPKKGAVVAPPPPAASAPPPLPPPPQSSVSLYELSFGTVCGVCAGVFVKKGARVVAFVFGGMFVLLQVSTNVTLKRRDRYPQLLSTCYLPFMASLVLMTHLVRPAVPRIALTRAGRLGSCCDPVRKSVLHEGPGHRSDSTAQRRVALPLDCGLLDGRFPATGNVHCRLCARPQDRLRCFREQRRRSKKSYRTVLCTTFIPILMFIQYCTYKIRKSCCKSSAVNYVSVLFSS